VTGDDEMLDAETLPHPAISPQANTEGLQAVRLFRNNGRTGLTQAGSPLPPDKETPVPNSAPTGRDETFIQRPWLLVLLLLHRFLHDSLLRNSIFIMATNVVTSLFGYLFWIVAARTYSAYDVGLGAALISVMTLASTIATLGIDSTLVQVLPRRRSDFTWSLALNAAMATGLLSGLLAGVIAVVILPFLSPQFAIVGRQLGYVFIFVVGVPVMIVSALLDQAFIAERAAHNKLVRQLVISVLKIPLLVLTVMLISQVGSLGILASWIVAMTITLIGGLLLLPRLGRAYRLAIRGILGQVRSMLSSLTGNFFINLGGLVPSFLLPVVVTIRLSPTDNAYFYTADRVGSFFFMASIAVATSLFAEGSHTAHGLSRKVRSSALITGIIFVPAMLLCILGGRYILLVFGLAYAEHGLLLMRLIAISAVPDAITNIYLSVLRVQERLRFAAFLNMGMGALTLVLTWILLPHLGIATVGWAFLLAQAAGSLVAGVDYIRFRHHPFGNHNAPLQADTAHSGTEASNQHIEELPGEGTY
jgi:O-antigen/teichoic acid export membrane protein